ncbi:hypothetical protein L227DRAFT_162051 [Lentinus tigrinus ALCF2SS1-6]|uniref:Secreted protein n=1 Tax=Lentinus tigrinus ALCF2SS1-6 TaxID=1328759 RepID=A0A5C2S6L1_9APHY|nr:hypothetical protein L227DRAFT_162051 [Lentinus tigrinus ALCF2SS1-6]
MLCVAVVLFVLLFSPYTTRRACITILPFRLYPSSGCLTHLTRRTTHPNPSFRALFCTSSPSPPPSPPHPLCVWPPTPPPFPLFPVVFLFAWNREPPLFYLRSPLRLLAYSYIPKHPSPLLSPFPPLLSLSSPPFSSLLLHSGLHPVTPYERGIVLP